MVIGQQKQVEDIMVKMDQIKPNMEVVGNDGEFVGIVDGIENDIELRLRSNDLTKETRRFLPLATVEYVDHRVHLNRTSIRAMAEWR